MNTVINTGDLLEPTPHTNQRTTVPHVSTALAPRMSLTAGTRAVDSVSSVPGAIRPCAFWKTRAARDLEDES